MKASTVFAFAFASALCFAWAKELPSERPDIGPEVPKDRPTTGRVEPVPLASTGYFAALLVAHYIDDPKQTPQFVSISVQRKESEHSSVVWFERQFPAFNVPREILTAKTKDIVAYDDRTRVVTFDLGMGLSDYKLPEE